MSSTEAKGKTTFHQPAVNSPTATGKSFMRYLAGVAHYAEAAIILASLALVTIVILPVVAAYRLARWAELQTIYDGDEQARDKDRWREL